MIKSSMEAPSGRECLSSINGARNRVRAVDYERRLKSVTKSMCDVIAAYFGFGGIGLGCSVGGETTTTGGVTDDSNYNQTKGQISVLIRR
jgi:hypothetical protein